VPCGPNHKSWSIKPTPPPQEEWRSDLKVDGSLSLQALERALPAGCGAGDRPRLIKASIDGTQVCPSLGVRSGKFTGDAHGSVDTTLEALRAELFLMIAKFYRTDPAATSFPDPDTAALKSSPGAAHRAFAAIDKSVSEGLPAMRLCMQDLQEEVAQKLGLAVDPETGLTESIESGEKRQRALRANSVRVHSLIYAAERYLALLRRLYRAENPGAAASDAVSAREG